MGEPGAEPDGLADVATRAEFGSRLTERRTGAQLSINAVARGSGVPRSTVADWCRAHRLPHAGQSDQFESMLRAMGVADTGPWLRALARVRAAAPRTDAERPGPYPGLASFRIDDAEWFFGREKLTAQAVARCQAVLADAGLPSMLVVVGPSGAGKSSLIHAGLCPRLVEQGFARVAVTPGRRPAARLAELPEGGPVVVVVDQLEEVFTACDDPDERDRFLARLAGLAERDETLVVVGLRIDFYPQLAATGHFSDALERSQLMVGAMVEAELGEVIVGPARHAGYSVDDDLLALVRHDFVPSGSVTGAHDAGALPLLSHALLETWRRSRRRQMRVADYLAAGGIDGAVAQSADQVFDRLDPGGQELARQLFLRLVRVDGDGPITRREAPLAELTGVGDRGSGTTAAEVIDRFVAARLLTAKADTVEIAHEALVAAWPRVRTWISSARESLRLHDQVRQAARHWVDSGHDTSALLRGARLAALVPLLDDESPVLAPSQDERAFLTASAAAERQAEADVRRRDRRRYQLVAAAVVLVFVLVGAVIVVVQTRKAADRAERLARSGDIASKAIVLRDRSPELAAQLALVAYRTDPTVTTRSVLLDTTAHPLATRQVDERHPAKFAMPVGDELAVATTDGGLTLRPLSGPARPTTLVEPGGAAITALAVDTGKNRIAAATSDGTIRLWHNGSAVDVSWPGQSVAALAFSPDGRTLAAGGDRTAEPGAVRLWDVAGTPRALASLDGPALGVTALAFAPDGRSLSAASRDKKVYRFDVTDLAAPAPLPTLTGPTGEVHAVTYSPDGRTVAAGTTTDYAVFLWDVSNPRDPKPAGILDQPRSWVNSVEFSPDGRQVVGGSGDGAAWVWDARSHEVLATLPHPGVVESAAYTDDHTVVTVGDDGVVRTWPTNGSTDNSAGDAVFALDFTGSGDALAVVPNVHDNRVHLFDTSRIAQLAPSSTLTPSGRQDDLSATGAFSPDGHYFAAGGRYGGLYVWDLTTTPPAEIAAVGIAHDNVTWLDYHPTAPYLVASAADDAAVIVDVADPAHPEVVARIDDTEARLNEARFSPDGTLLAIASSDGGVRLYRVTDPRAPRLIGSVEVDKALSPAFAPDGRLLAVGAGDDKVHLWDITDPAHPSEVGEPLDGPVSDVWQIAFDPDGGQLAAATTEGSVYVWTVTDPAAPSSFAVLRAMTDDVTAVTYDPSGDTLVAGAEDGSVRRWITDPEQTAHWICATSGTPITRAEWTQLLPDIPYAPPCG